MYCNRRRRENEAIVNVDSVSSVATIVAGSVGDRHDDLAALMVRLQAVNIGFDKRADSDFQWQSK